MKTRALWAPAVVVSLLAISGAANAACTISDFAGKTWRLTGTEITDRTLFFCTVPVSLATTATNAPIPAVTSACQDTWITTNTNQTFTSPAPSTYSIKSGTVTLLNPTRCIYEVTLRFDSGSPIARARVNLDAGKTVASGNFLVSWGGGGSWTMVRN